MPHTWDARCRYKVLQQPHDDPRSQVCTSHPLHDPACRRCWVLALQNAVNTVKNCCAERWAVVLSVLLLLWLARVLRGPCFFPVGFRAFWRARARPQPQNAAIYGVLLHVRFRAGLRAALFGLLFLRPLARARHPLQLNMITIIIASLALPAARHTRTPRDDDQHSSLCITIMIMITPSIESLALP